MSLSTNFPSEDYDMAKIDPSLIESASELRSTFLSLGMSDRAFVVDNIVHRAMRNAAAEEEIGTDAVERAGEAIRSLSGGLREVLSHGRVCNSDILAVLEGCEEDISALAENAEGCPDFVSVPAGMLLSGVSRVMRRMSGEKPSDRLGSDSIFILHRTLDGVSRYDEE
jgi:hypothetical protein